jgi:mRNA-degrading endonuclease RelE of RelBE toxin-antitoxin system
MAHTIELTRSAAAELKAIRAFERTRVVHEMEQQLQHEPTVVTRNRKRLEGVAPGFEHIPPIWELRVGEYRVFYDVNLETQTVYVRAIRRKEPGQTTAEIIT